MTAVDETREQQPFSPLVAAVVTQMFTDSAAVNSRVIDNLERTVADLEAELYAIRTDVQRLLDGPYMPNPDLIRSAVFVPSAKLIDEYKANKEVDW